MIKAINSYELGKDCKKDFQLFLLAFFLFLVYGLAYQLYTGWYKADSYVTTLLSFSYLKNGFIRRGLIGTLYDCACRVIPSALSYKGAFCFMWGMNIIYFSSLLLFVKRILLKIKDKSTYRGAFFFALICFAFMIPTACIHGGAFGRADLLQIALCLLQIYLVIEMKHEWLTVPLTAVNVMFHEGYVLMTFCAVLIVVIYRALNTKEVRRKYWILFSMIILALLVTSVLSFKGSSAGTAEGYDAALKIAERINSQGLVHWNLLAMMAGYSPQNAPVINDAQFVAEGVQELPIFLVCFIPAFYVFGKGIENLFKQAGGTKRGIHITAVVLGPALIGVEYIKFCDYGRYILWLVFYFFIVLLAFTAMNDQGAEGSLRKSYAYTNTKAVLVIALMMIYQPLPTCSFTFVSRKIRQFIGRL